MTAHGPRAQVWEQITVSYNQQAIQPKGSTVFWLHQIDSKHMDVQFIQLSMGVFSLAFAECHYALSHYD